MKRLLVFLWLSGAACAESVVTKNYDWTKDQLLVLVDAELPQQVYFRSAGAASWTATSSSTLEAPPPASGPWPLAHGGWTVVDAGNERLAFAGVDCTGNQFFGGIRQLAENVRIGPCHEAAACCSNRRGGILVHAGTESCVVPDEWMLFKVSELCVSLDEPAH